MQSVFVSFTFDPDPDFSADTEDLKRRVSMIVESMELRPITGEDLGGRNVQSRVRALIEKCDACISILTPHRTGSSPAWVTDEFAYSQGMGKPGIRIIHDQLATAIGMFGQDEHIRYKHDSPTDTWLKLMRTIALWKREYGRSVDIEIGPPDLARKFDVGRGHQCRYQLFTADNAFSGWRPAVIRREPGGTYVHIPGFPDSAKISLCIEMNGALWESAFHSPVGRVELVPR